MKISKILTLTLTILSLAFTSCNSKSAEAEDKKANFNTVFEFNDGYAIATYNGPNDLVRYAIVNTEYDPVIDGMMSIEEYSDRFWIAETPDNGYVIIDRQLKVTPFTFNSPELYTHISPDAIWAKNSDDELVLIDLTTGQQISKAYPHCSFDQVLDNGTVVLEYKPKRSLYKLADGYAIVSADGKELAPIGKYTFIGDFSNGLAAYSTTGFGIPISRAHRIGAYAQENTVNGNGNAKWFELGDKSGNFGIRESDNFKQGYINEMGEVVIPERFVYAQPFDEDGYAIVGGVSTPSKLGNRQVGRHREYSKIDKSGNTVATDLNVKLQHGGTLTEK